MKEYDELRQETLEAIRQFHNRYPNHKESDLSHMSGDLSLCGTTESNF